MFIIKENMPFEDGSISLCRLHSQMQIQPSRSGQNGQKEQTKSERFYKWCLGYAGQTLGKTFVVSLTAQLFYALLIKYIYWLLALLPYLKKVHLLKGKTLYNSPFFTVILLTVPVTNIN